MRNQEKLEALRCPALTECGTFRLVTASGPSEPVRRAPASLADEDAERARPVAPNRCRSVDPTIGLSNATPGRRVNHANEVTSFSCWSL